MTLFYVTGLSGTGKSAVLTELRARGFLGRGVDEDGFGDWINRESGAADKFPRDDPDFDFHEWYKTHDWVLSVRRIGVLRRAAARLGRPVFLCGVAGGDAQVWHLFDKVIALVADLETVKRRIASRVDNDFGKSPEELALIVALHRDYEANYRSFGAVIVDTARPLSEVVADVLDTSLWSEARRCVLDGVVAPSM